MRLFVPDYKNKLSILSAALQEMGISKAADEVVALASASGHFDFWQPRSSGTGYKDYAFRYDYAADTFEVLRNGKGPVGRVFPSGTSVHAKLMSVEKYWSKFPIGNSKAPVELPVEPTPPIVVPVLPALDLKGVDGKEVNLHPDDKNPKDDGAEDICFGSGGAFCVPSAIIRKNWPGKAGVDGWRSPGGPRRNANFHEIASYSGSYRSAAPYLHTEFFKYLRDVYGIHTVISLSGTVEKFRGENNMNEKSIAEADGVGMNFVFHSTTKNHFPGRATFSEIHNLVKSGGVLLHCTHGADRTGALISKMEIRDGKRAKGDAVDWAKRFGGFKSENVNMNAWAKKG